MSENNPMERARRRETFVPADGKKRLHARKPCLPGAPSGHSSPALTSAPAEPPLLTFLRQIDLMHRRGTLSTTDFGRIASCLLSQKDDRPGSPSE